MVLTVTGSCGNDIAPDHTLHSETTFMPNLVRFQSIFKVFAISNIDLFSAYAVAWG